MNTKKNIRPANQPAFCPVAFQRLLETSRRYLLAA